jgi:predicted ribosomally synthesized peptide with SipW-like signal peptide
MSINDHDGDYVLVHKTKAKISRARRLVIGIMAIGAVAAVANAGTFASFSASTTNDATFKTGKLVLNNTVDSGSTCISGYNGTGTATPDADLDTNDNGGCDAVFNNVSLKPGTTATMALDLENDSSSDLASATLSFWRDTCTDGTVATPAGSDPICDNLEIYVMETQSNYSTYVDCVFPSTGTDATDCTDFSLAQNLVSEVSDDPTAATAAGSLDQGVTKHYVVGVRLPTLGTFDGVTGVGLDNPHQYRTASFKLNWRIQEA